MTSLKSLRKAKDPQGRQLYVSAHDGDVARVRALLQQDIQPDDYRTENKHTALHAAAFNGHLQAVQLLLAHKASVNLRTALGHTAFYLASQQGHTAVLAELLQAGSDLEARSNEGCTPLFIAAQVGRTDTVRWLLERGAVVDIPRDTGHIPLHVAANYGHPDVVRLLCNSGAKVTHQTCKGNSTVHLAAYFGQLSSLRVLVEEYRGFECIDVRGRNNMTPLQQAQHNNKQDVVMYLQHLQQHGLKATAAKGLFEAASRREVERVAGLIRAGHHPDTHKGPYNTTSVHVAAANGHIQCLRLLVEAGGTLTATDTYGNTPLHFAVLNNHIDTVRLILGYDAGKQCLNVGMGQEKETPLQLARKKFRQKICDLLIEAERALHATDASCIVLNQQLWNYKLSSDVLGQGAWGSVHIAQHVDGGPHVALKKMSMEELSSDPRREVQALSSIPTHRNIVRFMDYHLSDKLLVIITELCEIGDLDKYFQEIDPDLAQRVDLMEQACCGLLHLHSQTPPVVHRHLKPANMLLKPEMGDVVLKLADFGMIRPVDRTIMQTSGGTLSFMAPEMLPSEEEGSVSFTKEVDIFSLGVVFQAMLRFRRGDPELKPLLEGKPGIKLPIPLAMQAAHIKGDPIPDVVVLRDDEPLVNRIKNLIKHMTSYSVKDRMKLSLVHMEIINLKGSRT